MLVPRLRKLFLCRFRLVDDLHRSVFVFFYVCWPTLIFKLVLHWKGFFIRKIGFRRWRMYLICRLSLNRKSFGYWTLQFIFICGRKHNESEVHHECPTFPARWTWDAQHYQTSYRPSRAILNYLRLSYFSRKKLLPQFERIMEKGRAAAQLVNFKMVELLVETYNARRGYGIIHIDRFLLVGVLF